MILKQPPVTFVETGLTSVFLAGGITNCPNWQADVVKAFENHDVALLNPRRDNFPIDNPDAAKEQIEWEFYHLNAAKAILFWFPKESICPIALYELGAWSKTNKPIFIGCHPEYPRLQDVQIQTELVKPNAKVHLSIEELRWEVKEWIWKYG